MEVSFCTLNEMIEGSDYIVIATIERKSPEIHTDGWVKYECKFLYWLKAPAQDQKELLMIAKDLPSGKKPEPIPLSSLESEGYLLTYPTGAPRSNSVFLVDDHEKPYHRLIEADPVRARLSDHEPFYNHYHLLFLCKDRDGKSYVTVGTYQSILPVSPLLDITKLPPQAQGIPLDENLAQAQSKNKMSLAGTIRFILKDYIAFKEKELIRINKDLEEVLHDRKPAGK